MKERLQTAMKDALRARDKVRLDTIRHILTAIQYEEIQKQVDHLEEDLFLEILKRESKKRDEELEYAVKANRPDLIEKLKREMQVIQDFLPKQLSETELQTIITDMKTQNPTIVMGIVMKNLKESFAGQYDGKLASKLAKEIVG